MMTDIFLVCISSILQIIVRLILRDKITFAMCEFISSVIRNKCPRVVVTCLIVKVKLYLFSECLYSLHQEKLNDLVFLHSLATSLELVVPANSGFKAFVECSICLQSAPAHGQFMTRQKFFSSVRLLCSWLSDLCLSWIE